ncbi:MAG: response regulator [Lachnospiraceae bacterium]
MCEKILVCDDAAFIRTSLKKILEPKGYIVFEAESGIDCINKFALVKPDLVILDITMPEMDGLTCLKELKKQYPYAVVVMCTAMGQQAMVVDAISSGAANFVVKPFAAEKILQIVEQELK